MQREFAFADKEHAAPRASPLLARDFDLEARQSQQPEVGCNGGMQWAAKWDVMGGGGSKGRG
jgi:hypothetical protein